MLLDNSQLGSARAHYLEVIGIIEVGFIRIKLPITFAHHLPGLHAALSSTRAVDSQYSPLSVLKPDHNRHAVKNDFFVSALNHQEFLGSAPLKDHRQVGGDFIESIEEIFVSD
jgi:hypothetical protein